MRVKPNPEWRAPGGHTTTVRLADGREVALRAMTHEDAMELMGQRPRHPNCRCRTVPVIEKIEIDHEFWDLAKGKP